MGKIRKLRQRARAARNIRTVAKTMEMVATVRFKQLQGGAQTARSYTGRLGDLVGSLIACGGRTPVDHPLLADEEEVERDILMVLTSDRGLCGTYNSSVLHVAMERMELLVRAGYEVRLHVVGKRGVRYLKFQGVEVDREQAYFGEAPDYQKVAELADSMMERFLSREIGGLEVAYTQFISSGAQRPAVAQILPLSELARGVRTPAVVGEPAPYEFLPSADEILEELLPATVRLRLYQCFLDASVSEHIARIVATRAATENADEMIQELTARYNKLRQSQITNELAEIMTGRAGLG